jgi:ribonucleotide reductase alpha subunit
MGDKEVKKEDFTILDKSFVNKYKNKKVNWGFNNLGYVVYKRTYARLKEDGTTEEWYETIERCINGAQKIGAKYTKNEAEKLYDYLFNLKCNFAGRMLWQLGTNTVDRFGANSLLNCWFTTIEKPEDFCFLFENLMLGGGVGFSIKREHVHQLPKVVKNVQVDLQNTKDADFIVPDKREGWVSLLRKVLNSYFVNGKSFTYSTILIRGFGEKINGFGGVSSGANILIDGISNICKILKNREGKTIRSIDALDICNIIGTIVVAGNVRRSAEIAIGDPDDILFLNAKRWDLGNIPNWRSMSNNTIYADDYEHLLPQFWNGYSGNGEPYGLLNLPLSQSHGRIGEKRKDNGEGGNPCNEVTLANKECCNLSELYLNNIETKNELIECAKLLYKTQKAICAMNFIHEETNKIVHKNMRIGIGVTGICQSENKLEWLDECYSEVRKFDKEWSAKNGWNESIKITTVKPSGTLSLLGGATPGIHPAYSRYYMRRVRMSSNDKLVELCRKSSYKVEYQRNFDGTEDRNTVVIEFPCYAGDNSIVTNEMTAIKQLELCKKLQTIWSDNSISVTVYYKPEELIEIKEWLKDNYKNSLKTVSFLLYSEHGFDQAPYQEIFKEEYEEMLKKIKPIEMGAINDIADIESMECVSGACPIR